MSPLIEHVPLIRSSTLVSGEQWHPDGLLAV